LFLAISLLVVILAATVTRTVGLSPILGALVAGLVIAETEYRNEVELVIEPFKDWLLHLPDYGRNAHRCWRPPWRLAGIARALVAVILVKALVTGALLRMVGARLGTAAETGLLMAKPVRTTLIILGAAGAVGILQHDTVAFWSAATAIGLTITPMLASLGRFAARRVDHTMLASTEIGPTATRRSFSASVASVG